MRGSLRLLFEGVKTTVVPFTMPKTSTSSTGIRSSVVEAAHSPEDQLRVLLQQREEKRQEATEYVPPLHRKWIKAPKNLLSTSLTRMEWFRMMQYNIMADCWSPFDETQADGTVRKRTTTPICAVDVKIPSSVRALDNQENTAVTGTTSYDAAIDTHVPPHLEWKFRQQHFLNEVRHYDPDIICVNELNKAHFQTSLWKGIRHLGYGCMFVSSRGRKVTASKPGAVGTAVPWKKTRVHPMEDVGSSIFFHKGRFVPIMMAGMETVSYLQFLHLCGIRDKVTNLTVFIAHLHLTPGNTHEAMGIREYEAKMALHLMDTMVRDNSDRSHGTVIFCGDFNNVHDEEPCVNIIRDRFYSTYDIAGSPWTSWYHQKSDAPNQYYEGNAEPFRAQVEQPTSNKSGAPQPPTQKLQALLLGPNKMKKLDESNQMLLLQQQRAKDESQSPIVDTVHLSDEKDALVLQKIVQLQQGVVQRTQDFIFYDPGRIGLLQVLDSPATADVDKGTLFPNRKNPSHHVPLLVDFAFHDTCPNVSNDSLSER